MGVAAVARRNAAAGAVFAALLFTLGMVGTGVLAVPVLTASSAYVAAQTFRFREGLDEPPQRAPRFYGVIAAGMIFYIQRTESTQAAGAGVPNA